MALPVGKSTENNNKELELVASLLEKTLKEGVYPGFPTKAVISDYKNACIT